MPTEKCDLVKTIPKSLTEKKVKHKPSGYARCSICSIEEKKNRRYFCIEKFCKDSKELGK